MSIAASLLTILSLLLAGPQAATASEQESTQPPPPEAQSYASSIGDYGKFFEKMQAAGVRHNLPFVDWNPGARTAPAGMVSEHFARKFKGAILLLIPDDWMRDDDSGRLRTIDTLAYWGLRGNQGGYIITRFPKLLVTLQAVYSAGSHLALRAEFRWDDPLPNEINVTELIAYVYDHLRNMIRIPWRQPEDMHIEAKQVTIDGIRVWTGLIDVGLPAASGVDPAVLPKDSLFENLRFTLIDSKPRFLGITVYLPDPDKTGWARMPRAVVFQPPPQSDRYGKSEDGGH